MKSRYHVVQDPRQQRRLALLRGIPGTLFAAALLALALAGGDSRQVLRQHPAGELAFAAECPVAPAADCGHAYP